MGRHPRLWLACQRAARTEHRSGRTTTEARRAAERARPDPRDAAHADGLEVVRHRVPVDGASISIWMYRAPGAAARPVHLLVHAGAFCYGDPKDVDTLARDYATTAGCAVVAVGYRLAPEHPWPVALEDTYAALAWVVGHAAELGIDAGLVSIGGISAGGCIAAAVAMMARDRGGPALVLQLLEIPITDLTMSCASMARFARGYLVTRAELAECYSVYLPDLAQRRNAYASPLLAEDLSGLPPATVLTAEYDPLRDEGEAYAHRLQSAGVAVSLIRARGHVHSSTYSTLRSARRYRQATAAALVRAYGGTGPG